MEDKKIAVEVYYEKCRALVSAIANTTMSSSDRETFVWILEEYFKKLGDAIEKF